jgi:hypothetical protein
MSASIVVAVFVKCVLFKIYQNNKYTYIYIYILKKIFLKPTYQNDKKNMKK